MNDLSPQHPDRLLYEQRSQSYIWQVRAQALKEIKENRYYLLWTYRDSPENQQEGTVGKRYPSMGKFTEDLPERPMPYKSAYALSQMADPPHFQRYELLRTANITMTFANRLFALDIDDPIIEILLLYMHFGGHDEPATKILTTSKSPLADAKALLKERLNQLPHFMVKAMNLV